MARASCAALLALYGLLGMIGSHSRFAVPTGGEPYTSSVEICTNSPSGRLRAYSSRLTIRAKLLVTNGAGSLMERSTCYWEA
jgi:hypothetical protein